MIELLMSPDDETMSEHKKLQLRELAALNGTLKDEVVGGRDTRGLAEPCWLVHINSVLSCLVHTKLSPVWSLSCHVRLLSSSFRQSVHTIS
jgi:hypothetical protein